MLTMSKNNCHFLALRIDFESAFVKNKYILVKFEI